MHRCKHIPQPLKSAPQAKAVVRASTSPIRVKLFFKISFTSKNFKNANPQSDTKTFGQTIAKPNIDGGLRNKKNKNSQGITLPKNNPTGRYRLFLARPFFIYQATPFNTSPTLL